VHPALRNAPELLPHSLTYFNAFNELVCSRQIGMASGPIPYSEIISWVNENEKIGDIRDMYIDMIQFIDITSLNIDSEKKKTAKPNNKR